MRTRAARLTAVLGPVLGSLALLNARCPSDADPPPPDTTAPFLAVVFPAAHTVPLGPQDAWDRDSNGLVDVELRWSDAGGVDTTSLRVEALDSIPGAPRDTNLARGWRLVERTDSSLRLEETIPLLLRNGATTLRISVADSAGNTTSAERRIGVPPGALHRVLPLGHIPPARATEFVLTADGRKGFVPMLGGGVVAVFDPDGVQAPRLIRNVPFIEFAATIAYDTSTGRIFIGGGGGPSFGFAIVDVEREVLLGTHLIPETVARVSYSNGRLYVGDACSNADLLVLDALTFAEIGRVRPQVPSGSICANTHARAFTTNGAHGWANVIGHGYLSFDAQSFQVVRRFDAQPPTGDADSGDARAFALLNDRLLYVAKLADGIDEVDVTTGAVTNHYPINRPPDPSLRELALNPDGDLLFVTGSADAIGPATTRAPLLLEVPGLRLRYAFPHRPGRIIDGVVWHPDGKRVLTLSEYEIDVYLVRR